MPLDNNSIIEAVAQKHPLNTKAIYRSVFQGGTVADIVAGFELDPRYGIPQVHLMRGGEMTVVPVDMWSKVRPKAGTRIEISYKVEGPIAALAVSALTAAAPAIVGTLFPALVAGTFWYTVAVAAITVVGSLILNALIPPVKQQKQGPENYVITGIQNMENRYGVFPKVLGRMRMFPMKTARGFTETVGQKIFYRGRMTFGWGPLSLEDLRIGTTPIHEFDGVELEFLNVDQTTTLANYPELAGITKAWRSGEDVLTLCPDDVLEDPYNVALLKDEPVTRFTRERTESASVDVAFPGGLIWYTKEGDPRTETVQFRFRWREVGGSWVDAGVESYGARETSYIRFTKTFGFPEIGTYEIEITRLSNNQGNSGRARKTSFLSAVRSFRSGGLPSHNHIAEVAFRLRASEQLSGNVDSLNAVVQQHAPRWTGTDWTAPEPVRHPAWIFLEALRGKHLRKPVTDDRIDIETFRAWATEEPHWTCDYVVDTDTRVAEVLDIIAATGRASRAMTDLQYSILRDNANGPIRQMFSQRNSWGFKAKIAFPKDIHAFRCIVRSERLEWEQDEVTVYADGYDHTNATEFETLEIPGIIITKEAEDVGNAWKLGRYHMAQAKLRPETYEWNADWEHMRVTRGDKVQLVHDVPVIGVGAARITDIAPPRNLLVNTEDLTVAPWGSSNSPDTTFQKLADGFTRIEFTAPSTDRRQPRFQEWPLPTPLKGEVRYARALFRPGPGITTIALGFGTFAQFLQVAYNIVTGQVTTYVLSNPGSIELVSAIEVDSGVWELVAKYTAGDSPKRTVYVHFGTGTAQQLRTASPVGYCDVGFVQVSEQIAPYQRVGSMRVPILKLDEVYDLNSSTNYRLTVRAQDGERITFTARSPTDPNTREWASIGALPPEIQTGDLVFVEELTQESMEVLVTGIYPDGDNARITAVAAAPGVLAADSGVIPPYDPIITEPNDSELLGPPKPVVSGLASNITTAVTEHDGSLTARAAVWLKPFAGTQFSSGAMVQLRWRETPSGGLTESLWVIGGMKPVTEYVLHTDALTEGVAYDLQVRTVGDNGRSRGWVAAGSVLAGISGATPTPLAASFRAVGIAVVDSFNRDRKPAIEIGWLLGDNNYDIQGLEWQIRVSGQSEILRGSIIDAGQNDTTEPEVEKTLIITEGIIPETVYEVRARFITYREANWTPWAEVLTPTVLLGMADMSQDLIDQFEQIASEAGIATVSALPPEGDFDNQIVMLIPQGILYRWDATLEEWSTKVYASPGPNTVTTDALVAGAVVTSKIASGAVTADRMDVNELSAITATVGILRTATSGARQEIHSDKILIYDASNVVRVRVGNLL